MRRFAVRIDTVRLLVADIKQEIAILAAMSIKLVTLRSHSCTSAGVARCSHSKWVHTSYSPLRT